MMLRTIEDAEKEFQEKLYNLRNSITYQKLCIVCSKIMEIKIHKQGNGKSRKTCSNTCRSRYNRHKDKYNA